MRSLYFFTADYFFKTDFRLWVLTLKAFDADKVVIGLRYLPFFLFFYIVNSISCNCFNYNNVGGKFNTAIFGLFNAGGAIGYVLIQYLTYFTTGLPKWYANEGEMISGIWCYCPIFFLFVTPFITRAVYKEDKESVCRSNCHCDNHYNDVCCQHNYNARRRSLVAASY